MPTVEDMCFCQITSLGQSTVFIVTGPQVLRHALLNVRYIVAVAGFPVTVVRETGL
jgi:hypothetical protein